MGVLNGSTGVYTAQPGRDHVWEKLRMPVDLVFGAPPEPELPSQPGMEYFMQLRERLVSVHKPARDTLANDGLKQR